MSVALYNGSITELGLQLSPDTTYEEFESTCFVLGKMHEAVRFAIGDAIIQGEQLFGEEVYQALEALHLSEEAKREYVRVASRVPRSLRRKNLSWSHHRAVAALPTYDEKRSWLKRAYDEDLSHHALREELRTSGTAAPSAAPARCRCCGRDL